MKPSPSSAAVVASLPPLEDFLSGGERSSLAVRRYLQVAKAHIAELFQPGTPVSPLLFAASGSVDAALQHLWAEHLGDDAEAALIAVGGYGRGELFPQSDVDILVLTRETPNAVLSEKLERFITSLWDTGLQIGHSVRTLTECEALARDDLTVVTTMMEARHLSGDSSLEPILRATIDISKMWSPNDFIRGKLGEQQNRHDKHSNTEYALEPNIKSSPGGLRDLQVIEWITLRCFDVGLDRVNEPDFLSQTELEQLKEAKEFLSQVRFALHKLAGRAEDRLLFDHQKKLAGIWGMADGDKLAVEQFMQMYYRWMKTLSQLNDLLIEVFEHRLSVASDQVIRIIDQDFEVSDSRIRTRHDSVFIDNPSNLLRVFVLIGNDPLVDRIEPNTQRLIRRDAHLIDEQFRANAANRALFLDALYKDEAASPIAAITSNKLMSEQFRDTVGAGISHYYDLYNLLNKKSFLISYYEKSNYYDYHHDLGLFTALTYLWKEPRAFEGGEIKFKLKDNTEFRPGIKNNRCIIFPSYIKHAAEEVYMDDSNLDQGMGRYCISCFLHFDLDKAHQDKENSISR